MTTRIQHHNASLNVSLTTSLYALCFAVFLTGQALAADDQNPTNAAIASAHPLATEAGHTILEQGGNAFDAAIAVSAALGVVEPYASGLGGGGFYLLHRADDNQEVVIDAREVAPQAIRREMFLDSNGNPVPNLSRTGGLAAAIPGQPAALQHLAQHYGTLSLKTDLAPAIALASTGFPADQLLIDGIKTKRSLLAQSAETADVFLPDGSIPSLGQKIIQTNLATTLRLLAEHGSVEFYNGQLAKKLVAGVRQQQGVWVIKDLNDYRVIERKPLQATIGNLHIVTTPPPSAGGFILVNSLHMLEQFNGRSLSGADHIHLMTEIWRRAYVDRAMYFGDPDFVHIPLDMLLSPAHIEDQVATISFSHKTPSDVSSSANSVSKTEQHTTHFSILDKEGNYVAATLSINTWFGSGVTPKGTGVILNNEMDDFAMSALHPNAFRLVGGEANFVQPGKRMLSSMMPTFLKTDQRIAILGTPGGSRIPTMMTLAALAFLDGADAKTMVSTPRYHHQYLPDEILYEREALADAIKSTLREKGHTLTESSRAYGNMQVIIWDLRSNRVYSASDPRALNNTSNPDGAQIY